MTPRTYAPSRIDDNQPEIVKALREAGCSVESLAMVGHGVPDLLVACPDGRTLLLEVKDGEKPPSARRLTDDEREWQDRWTGECWTVESVEAALRVVEAR